MKVARRTRGLRGTRSLVPLFVAMTSLGLSPTTSVRAVDDDLLAHRLYREGRYAEAAELFTDPAWKGIALYRAEQWWRAADAFVRADDARSAHNLGNAYVKLGYHELALDAYRRALALDPTLDDARHNADVMLKLLALGDDGQGGGRSPSENELDRVERERPDEERDEGSRAGESGAGESEREESGAGESAGKEEESDGDEGTSPDEPGATDEERQAERGDGEGGALGGTASASEASNRASGGAESDEASERSEAAGRRGDSEGEQATAQWLARIAHDPRRFLERRIALELRRRRAAGRAAPEGGDGW